MGRAGTWVGCVGGSVPAWGACSSAGCLLRWAAESPGLVAGGGRARLFLCIIKILLCSLPGEYSL